MSLPRPPDSVRAPPTSRQAATPAARRAIRTRRWTDERIAGALTEFLANGRTGLRTASSSRPAVKGSTKPCSPMAARDTGHSGCTSAGLSVVVCRTGPPAAFVSVWAHCSETATPGLPPRSSLPPASSDFSPPRGVSAGSPIGPASLVLSHHQPPSLTPVRSACWTDERIAAAIAPLVAKLGRWPTKGEFRNAGLGPALAAVYSHGGSSLWQRRFGVEPLRFDGHVPNRSRWDDQQIEAALRVLYRKYSRWPTLAEFDAAQD